MMHLALAYVFYFLIVESGFLVTEVVDHGNPTVLYVLRSFHVHKERMIVMVNRLKELEVFLQRWIPVSRLDAKVLISQDGCVGRSRARKLALSLQTNQFNSFVVYESRTCGFLMNFKRKGQFVFLV